MRRRKKGAGLKRLVELAGVEMPTPVPKSDVIKVNAVPMGKPPPPMNFGGPVDEREIVLPLFGSMGVAPSAMKYKVNTVGDDYEDQRGMAYQENQDGTWKMQVMWSAEGSNGMPHGFKVLGKMAQFFNFAANMMIGGDVEVRDQKIDSQAAALPAAKPPGEEPLHMKVLGYLQGERERPC